MLETTVGELFRRSVRYYGGRVAVKEGPRAITYAELGADVNRLANALTGVGLGRGERVALLMWNCAEYITCDFAAASAGLVKVPLNHLLSRDEVQFRIQDSEAAAVICDEHFIPMVEEVTAECPSLRHRICITEGGRRRAPAGFTAFADLSARGVSRDPDLQERLGRAEVG